MEANVASQLSQNNNKIKHCDGVLPCVGVYLKDTRQTQLSTAGHTVIATIKSVSRPLDTSHHKFFQ